MTHVLQGRETKANKREKEVDVNDAMFGNRKAEGKIWFKMDLKIEDSIKYKRQEEDIK